MTNVAPASELLKPCDARLMRCYPVSMRINSVANDDTESAEEPVDSYLMHEALKRNSGESQSPMPKL